MPHAELVGNRVVVETQWMDKDLIAQVPGLNYSAQTRMWQGPASWATAVILRGVFGARLTMGPALVDWVQRDHERRIAPCLQLRNYTQRLGLNMKSAVQGFDPYDFQEPGASFLMYAECAVLADDMGTGKTIQAVIALRALREAGHAAFPVCCVVPNSTKTRPWRRTFEEWDPAVRAIVIGGSATDRAKALDEARKLIEEGHPVAVIIHWEAARIHSRLAPYGSIRLERCVEHGGAQERVSRCHVHPKELNLLGFRTVIADEAHKMKDPQSQQTRALWAIGHGETVKYRWALTGTPIADSPRDLWPLGHFVAPDEYPSMTKYTDRYCLLAWNPFGTLDVVGVRPDTKHEFYAILDPRFRRMPKDLVLPFLPPKQRDVREAPMTPKQARAYKDVSEGMLATLEDGSYVIASNNLTKALRLLQFSSSYAEVDEYGQVKLSEPSPKLDVMDEVLAELGTKPLVVCAESRQLIMLAAARLEAHKPPIPYSMIIGGMTDDQRDNALGDFDAGRTRVMLFTIKAGGVGLTMTAADTILFLQRSWSMIDNKQAEDRVHRIGAERHESIMIIDCVAPGTIEQDQINRLTEKAERLEEIVRDKQTLRQAAQWGDQNALTALARLDEEEQIILHSDLTGRVPGSQPMMEEVA